MQKVHRWFPDGYPVVRVNKVFISGTELGLYRGQRVGETGMQITLRITDISKDHQDAKPPTRSLSDWMDELTAVMVAVKTATDRNTAIFLPSLLLAFTWNRSSQRITMKSRWDDSEMTVRWQRDYSRLFGITGDYHEITAISPRAAVIRWDKISLNTEFADSLHCRQNFDAKCHSGRNLSGIWHFTTLRYQ